MYDIRSGFDLAKKDVQERMLQKIKRRRPRLVVICPPCQTRPSLSHFRSTLFDHSWMKARWEAKVLLRFAMQVATVQLAGGRLLIFAQPASAASWTDHAVVAVSHRRHVETFTLHPLPRRRTRAPSNSPCIRARLELACRADPEQDRRETCETDHEPMPPGSGSELALAQVYPQRLSVAICQGLMLESEANQSTKVRSCVIAVEQIQADEGDGVSDTRITSLIMRCHVNLGHPSLVGMLEAARASDHVLKLARGLTRSTCEPVKGEKTYRVARVENAVQPDGVHRYVRARNWD